MAKKKSAPASKKPAMKKAAPAKPAAKPTPWWVESLLSGPAGVKRWNNLTAAGRAEVSFGKGDFTNANLTGINLRGMTATKIKAAGAKLTDANLLSASFIGGNFAGADLTGANLREFNGRDADFTGAKLVGTELWQARLLRTKFVRADLTRANFTEADITATDFTDAVLTDANLTGATFDHQTKWPAGFAVPGEVLWAGKGTDPRLSGKGKNAVASDINGLLARLHANIDERRMKRVFDMLKKERNQIFSEVEPTLVRGIVKSQRDVDTVYSCVLTDDGTYSCCTPDMSQCMGLSNEPCKHLLVLVIGLTRAGQFDPPTADKWLVAANKKGPRWNKTVQSHMADSLLKYKGVQAGEVDWRPTETIPEDFYAM